MSEPKLFEEESCPSTVSPALVPAPWDDDITGAYEAPDVSGHADLSAETSELIAFVPALVLICGGEELPKVSRLARGSTYVGREHRAEDRTLVLRQSSVSRVHACVRVEGDRCSIEDLKSMNGVFVNGERIGPGKVELAPNDVIRIGDALYKFTWTFPESYELASEIVPELVGGAQMSEIVRDLVKIAPSNLSVFVQGETGTGKEIVARAIHRLSGRPGRIVALNCAAIPTSLFESELFGFRRGSFTGATQNHDGLVRAAHEGTLFLDEIGDLSLEAQAKLLRVIESKEVQALGSTTSILVDIRIVSATHKDLAMAVRQGTFRADLFARLNGANIRLPPLRERKEDLPALVEHLLSRHGVSDRKASFAFMHALALHSWPFNVRELDAVLRRAVSVNATGAELTVADLPRAMLQVGPASSTAASNPPGVVDSAAHRSTAPPAASLPPQLGDRTLGAPSLPPLSMPREVHQTRPWRRRPHETELVTLLTKHQGNIAAVARAMKRDRSQVHRWMKELGISADRFRALDDHSAEDSH